MRLREEELDTWMAHMAADAEKGNVAEAAPPTDAELEQLVGVAVAKVQAEQRRRAGPDLLYLRAATAHLQAAPSGPFFVINLAGHYLLVPAEGTTTLRQLGSLSRLCRRALWMRREVHQRLKQLYESSEAISWEHWREIWYPPEEPYNPPILGNDIPWEAMTSPPSDYE